MRTNKVCAILGNIQRFNALLPLTKERPLATLPFAGKYRLIDFPISSIVNANIKTLYMIFNKGETQSVFDHIGGGKEWNLEGVHNRFFIHMYQNFLKLKANEEAYYGPMIDYLEKSKSIYTVFMSSKMICNIDLQSVIRFHHEQDKDMTVVYKKVAPHMMCESDVVLSFSGQDGRTGTQPYTKDMETKEKENLCMDIFIVKTDWLIKELEKGQQENATANIKHFLQNKLHMVSSAAYEYKGYLNNIFDVTSYYNASLDMLNKDAFCQLLYSGPKIYTKLKNEVPTYYAKTSDILGSQFATGCMIRGTVEHSAISRGTVIEEEAIVKDSIVNANVKIENGATIAYAILDKNVRVDQGVNIIGRKDNPVVISKNKHVTDDVRK